MHIYKSANDSVSLLQLRWATTVDLGLKFLNIQPLKTIKMSYLSELFEALIFYYFL